MTVTPKICLNMIVKNESKIIARLLESVSDLIDTYCICDTGSTDDTISIITDFFQKKNITGKVIQEAFRDFGYNRTFALKACDELDADYVLLLDADMILWRNKEISAAEFKRMLNYKGADLYHISQGTDTYYYRNVRIVRNKFGFTYWGVTHEYVDCPSKTVTAQLEKNDIFIYDIGDGGAKTDKFLRDIRLLKKGLEDLPNNDRYTFYLANSYKDSGQPEHAIDTYKKRIEIGGWIEEVWYSYYCIGKCWMRLGEAEKALCAWLEGFDAYPNRIENLYEVIQHYRNNGKNKLAYYYYRIADEMRTIHTGRDYLFMQKDIYDYKIDYELSIIGYYYNTHKYNLRNVSMKVLTYPHVDESIMRNTMSNYKFYREKAKDTDTGRWLVCGFAEIVNGLGRELVGGGDGEFYSSTPSFCRIPGTEGDWLFLVRYVNYKINGEGGYDNKEHIETRNVMAILRQDPEDKTWTKVREGILEYDTVHDGLYVGLEDVRLFAHGDKIYYNANRGLERGHMVVEHGEIDWCVDAEGAAVEEGGDVESGQTVVGSGFATKNSAFLEMAGQRTIEKNWVMFNDDMGNMKMIYGWKPLIIGDVVVSDNGGDGVKDGNKDLGKNEDNNVELVISPILKQSHSFETIPFFKNIRGSCNGIFMEEMGEIWFLCHVVSYEDRRYYYHTVIALDAKTYKIKKYTPLFTFEGEKVEYALGIARWGEELLIGYSIMDCSTKYLTIPQEWLANRMVMSGVSVVV